jgi:hypothetical protein
MTTKKEATDLVVAVKADNEHGIRRLRASILYRDPRDRLQLLTPRFDVYGTARDYAAFAGLELTAYLDENRDLNDGRPWGFSYHYNTEPLEFAQARAIVKTLRKIQRGLDGLAAERGHPRDFATFIINVASLFGVRSYAEYSRQQRPDGSHWRWMNADQLHRWIGDNSIIPAP